MVAQNGPLVSIKATLQKKKSLGFHQKKMSLKQKIEERKM